MSRSASPNPALFEISWAEDRAFRMSPQVVTDLLREQVPVLEFVDWQVQDIQPGQASALLPLNPQSTNQHFTHQAAMFVLSADYTGGTALASLLTGWPVIGVHPVTSPHSMSLWLLEASVKYLRPSVGDLTVTATIAPERRAKIIERFHAGRAVVETVEMTFFNGEVAVARATSTYFARRSTALRAVGVGGEDVNPLYALKLTSSAELIAGVRARTSGGLFEDPFAERMAGQHGMALATRFCERSPQLEGMVAARTRHLDDVMLRFVHEGGRHIVNIGVGWDMRAFRLDLPAGTRFYELDFPTTLTERAERIEAHGLAESAGVTRHAVPIDLRTMTIAETLRGAVPSDVPVLVVWEGMSMYFQEDEVGAILEGLAPLLAHPQSALWLDLMARAPVDAPESFPQVVQDFMRGMQILGEPFTFGCDDPAEYLAARGLHCEAVATAASFHPDATDPIFEIYRFCVARSSGPTNRRR